MGWYSKVAKDIQNLPDAIEYFTKEFESARKDCRLYGSIDKALSTLPGITEHRYSQLQEIEAILELLNIELKHIRSYHFKKYLEHYARALSSRDCEKYVDGEDDVIEFEKMINEFALIRNQWLSIMKAIDQKSYSLNNITKLRCSGLDDASMT
jgi:hypothetical protein